MTKPTSDHALAVIKAGVSLVPVVGGSIASLIGDYIPTATQRDIEKTIDYLKDELERLKDRIDAEAVDKDEFSELFKSCYLVIVRTHQQDKLRTAAHLIANILLKEDDPERLTYTALDHFVQCLDRLSVGAMEVLIGAYQLAARMQRTPPEAGGTRLEFSQLHGSMHATSPDLLMGLLGELNSLNLIHFPGAPTISTDNYGNYTFTLTTIGAQFVSYLMRPGELREQ